MRTNLLLSIKPKYAKKIYTGEKTVELRKTKPDIGYGDTIFGYETSPVKAITGFFIVDYILQTEYPLGSLDLAIKKGCVTKDEFYKYAEWAKKLVLIFIKDSRKIPAIPLDKLRKELNINAPQSYRYLTQEQAEELIYWTSNHYWESD